VSAGAALAAQLYTLVTLRKSVLDDGFGCYGSQKTEFLWRKKGYNFCQKYKIKIFVKNSTFFSGFSIVVQQNQGVQLKDRLF